MNNVSPSPSHVKSNLDSNVRIALAAGYSIHCGPVTVKVNGVAVDRELFEDLHPLNLLALLDKHIGRWS